MKNERPKSETWRSQRWGICGLFLCAVWVPQALALAGEWRSRPAIDSVNLDDVAPEDRAVRGDDRLGGAVAMGTHRSAGADAERRELGAFAHVLYRLLSAIPAFSPVNAKSWLTSGFGWRRGPVTGRREFHGGVDLAAPRGTAVVATADGVAESVFWDAASGTVVVIDHGNGLETVYGHLDAAVVVPGQEIQRGAIIGRVGSTGWRSTGPHLHYGIRIAQKYVDPGRYLFARGTAPQRQR